MRPVQPGHAPREAVTYEKMRPALIERLGCYCSYCEFPVHHAPHAEHIIPKKRFPAWRDRWENLLVSCTWCNGHKGDERPAPGDVDEYLWPSRDNTALAFSYANIIPEVAGGLTPAQRTMAARLRGLVHLGLTGDARAKARAATSALARHYRSQMSSAPDPALLRETIVELAMARGFFSVWMDIFADDPLVRRMLVDAFAGTAQECFDPGTTAPVQRPNGRI